MTRDEALALADRILVLVNSKPATPSREEIADAILIEAYPHSAPIDALVERIMSACFPHEGKARYRSESLRCAHCGTAWNEGQGHANCPPEFRRSVSEDGGIELTPEEAAQVRKMLGK